MICPFWTVLNPFPFGQMPRCWTAIRPLCNILLFSGGKMKNRRRLIPPFVLAPLFVGLIGLFELVRKPRFETFHTVDVLQLLASGMCFGVALAALIAILRGSRTD